MGAWLVNTCGIAHRTKTIRPAVPSVIYTDSSTRGILSLFCLGTALSSHIVSIKCGHFSTVSVYLG